MTSCQTISPRRERCVEEGGMLNMSAKGKNNKNDKNDKNDKYKFSAVLTLAVQMSPYYVQYIHTYI